MMNVQEVLENYNVYKLRISIIEKEIQELKSEMYDLKSSKLDGMPKAKGYTMSKLEENIVNCDEKINKKQRYIDDLKSDLKIVEDLVKTIKKNNQNINNMRFYQNISIDERAVKKDRGYGAIQKTIDRSIKKMQKEYEKNKKLS